MFEQGGMVPQFGAPSVKRFLHEVTLQVLRSKADSTAFLTTMSSPYGNAHGTQTVSIILHIWSQLWPPWDPPNDTCSNSFFKIIDEIE